MSLHRIVEQRLEQTASDVIALSTSHLDDNEVLALYRALRDAYATDVLPAARVVVPGSINVLRPIVRDMMTAFGLNGRGDHITLMLLGIIWLAKDSNRAVGLGELERVLVDKARMDPELVKSAVEELRTSAAASGAGDPDKGVVMTEIAVAAIPRLIQLIAAQRDAARQTLGF